MAELKDRVRRDLTAAMKAREALTVSTLRMVMTAITNAEVSGTDARELTDDEVQAVVASEAKKRRESAQAFADAGRDELAAKERAEAEILAGYLPEQLGPDQIAAAVRDAVAELGVAGDGMKAMGRVMGIVQPRLKGRADGSLVAAEVRRQLSADGPG